MHGFKRCFFLLMSPSELQSKREAAAVGVNSSRVIRWFHRAFAHPGKRSHQSLHMCGSYAKHVCSSFILSPGAPASPRCPLPCRGGSGSRRNYRLFPKPKEAQPGLASVPQRVAEASSAVLSQPPGDCGRTMW